MKFTPRQFRVRHLLLLVAIAAVVSLVAKSLLFPSTEAMGAGSPKYAEKWKSAFEAVETPEAARSRYSEVFVKRFADGSWLFGVCRGSHGDPDGGTIVVKDSTGEVRAFFGHVCDPDPDMMAQAIPDRDLASFSNIMKTARFTEYSYP